MSETTDAVVDGLPADVAAMVGRPLYEEVGEFPVEQGYIWTSCASVENANPLFWDDGVAAEVTGGPIAPPSMLSVSRFIWSRVIQGMRQRSSKRSSWDSGMGTGNGHST